MQSWKYSPEHFVPAAHGVRKEPPEKPRATSELLRIFWERLILDEGHYIGGSPDTNRALLCAQIRARARWVCTGTPTPSVPGSELKHLHGLMCFLGVAPYCKDECWRRLVTLPFEEGQPMGFIRVYTLLSRLMMRHTKKRLIELNMIPRREIRITEIVPSQAEQESYNALITIIRRNLLLAESDGNDVDSLLNPRNRESALQAIGNLRKACCVTGMLRISANREHLQETRNDICRRHLLTDDGCLCNGSYFNVHQQKIIFVEGRSGRCPLLARNDASHDAEFRARANAVTETFQSLHGKGDCSGCSRRSLFPLVAPCGHMLCIECAEQSLIKAKGSASHAATSEPQALSCAACRTDFSAVLFSKFQPAVESGIEWESDWIETLHSKARHLMQQLHFHGHFDAHQVNHEYWAAKVSATQPLRSSKSRAGKCIVFSNFIEMIDLVANTLWEVCGDGCYMRLTANMKGGMKERCSAVKEFRHNPKVSVLLMDTKGAHGFDLSFVSHLFIMDPIWDASVEDQVISRAHRLGANPREPIVIEKLLAADTVEVMMERQLRRSDGALLREPEPGRDDGDSHERGKRARDEDERKREVRKRDEEEKKKHEQSKIEFVLRNAKLLGSTLHPARPESTVETPQGLRAAQAETSPPSLRASGMAIAQALEPSVQSLVHGLRSTGTSFFPTEIDADASQASLTALYRTVKPTDRPRKQVRFET